MRISPTRFAYGCSALPEIQTPLWRRDRPALLTYGRCAFESSAPAPIRQLRRRRPAARESQQLAERGFVAGAVGQPHNLYLRYLATSSHWHRLSVAFEKLLSGYWHPRPLRRRCRLLPYLQQLVTNRIAHRRCAPDADAKYAVSVVLFPDDGLDCASGSGWSGASGSPGRATVGSQALVSSMI